MDVKQKIRFKAIDYRGIVVTFTEVVKCPKFDVIPPKVLHGYELPETSVESQLIDWFDEQDKTSIMDARDISIILDYSILKKKSNKPKLTIFDLINSLEVDDKIKIDLVAVYKEIKPNLKGMSLSKQLLFIISHASVGYQAISESYKTMNERLNNRHNHLNQIEQ